MSRKTGILYCYRRHVSFSAGVALKWSPGAQYILYSWPVLRQTQGCCLSPLCATVRVNTGSAPHPTTTTSPYLKMHRGKPVTHSKHMLNIQFSPAGFKDGADPWGRRAAVKLFAGAQTVTAAPFLQQHVSDATTISRLFINRLSPFNRPRTTNPPRRGKKKERSFTNCQHAEWVKTIFGQKWVSSSWPPPGHGCRVSLFSQTAEMCVVSPPQGKHGKVQYASSVEVWETGRGRVL